MPFDFQQAIFDYDGECDEDAYEAYVAGLREAFAASPEGMALDDIGWIDLVTDFARSYFAATLASIQPSEFEEIVWEFFPRKVSCDPAEAPAIIKEFRAFWAFAGREFGHAPAAVCLAVVGDGAEAKLEQYLGERRRHGMAKSLFSGGLLAGIDLGTGAGPGAWTAAQDGLTLLRVENTRAPVDARGAAERKAKRKREKAARKKSRG